jgi:phage tail tube protein FII
MDDTPMNMPMDTGASVDGNALAGSFGELMATDLTVARARCAACGMMGPIAETLVYDRSAGAVSRCPGCDAVLMTLVRSDDRAFISFRGVSFLEIATS